MTLIGIAALYYLGGVGLSHLLDRSDPWVGGIVALGPFAGTVAVQGWKPRRSQRDPR